MEYTFRNLKNCPNLKPFLISIYESAGSAKDLKRTGKIENLYLIKQIDSNGISHTNLLTFLDGANNQKPWTGTIACGLFRIGLPMLLGWLWFQQALDNEAGGL